VSFDKVYPNRKDWRKPYRGCKAFDRTCRNHGSCPWCNAVPKFKVERRKSLVTKEEKNDYNL